MSEKNKRMGIVKSINLRAAIFEVEEDVTEEELLDYVYGLDERYTGATIIKSTAFTSFEWTRKEVGKKYFIVVP